MLFEITKGASGIYKMTCEIPVSLQLTSGNKHFFMCVLGISNSIVCSYLSFWLQERVKYLKHILFI